MTTCTRIFAIITFLTTNESSFAQSSILFQKCLGGTKNESCYQAQPTSDGGILVVGSTNSNDGDVAGLHDTLQDFWVVKLDQGANIEWQKCLGGSNTDIGYGGYEAGNGYLIYGYSKSTDGDLTVNYGDFDYWIVRLDKSGNIVWQKSIGGSGVDNIQLGTLSGDKSAIVVTGFTNSHTDDFVDNIGLLDLWVTKVDTFGNIVWNKNYGGTSDDIGVNVSACAGGGYIVSGSSASTDGDVTGCDFTTNTWVLRLNEDGDLMWQKCLGGSDLEQGFNAIEVSDGSFMILNFTGSNDGDVTGNHGSWDIWLTHLDNAGNLIWQKCYGGTDTELPLGLLEISDSHFLVSGWTFSTDGDVFGNHGSADGWIFEVDSSGNLIWQKCIGGSDYDPLWSISSAIDGTLLFAGGTTSNDGDVSGNHGASDILLFGLSFATSVPPPTTEGILNMHVLSNPVSDHIDLSLRSTEASELNIELINEKGQIVMSNTHVKINAADKIISLDCSYLPSGNYHLVAINEKWMGQTKVVVVR